MLIKIGVLKSFAIFTGKRLCWSLFLSLGLQRHRKKTPTQVLRVNIAKFLKTVSFNRTSPVAASGSLNFPAMFFIVSVLKEKHEAKTLQSYQLFIV